ncbi:MULTISPECIES: hypothetical protein [Bradyrhizobium]|uniref:hypothetical protein n=1 Tax=Bradyrhizobium TaxID=374 RepID=UPI0008412D18|nr:MULTISPECIES: hypothetical protein [Bradyrhizobium]MCP1931294.1 hypothetical protein [Bradyrhizobium elkanii]MCS3480581.1 hypothetical protein [Bradyrhizobium elkanii]MCS3578178.1 hypothetical protein [Bradyrhizobium elkanii]MCS3721053.1 hypothetical protein [Bradyrhizobium elkanii]MCS4005469.1 hypothetical protein [Bradyrhizobium elkanii USDA 61]
MINRFGLAAALALLLGSSSTAPAQSLPDYMGPISGKTSSTPADVATKDVLALNTGMFELYGDAARIFQKNILDKHPVILGLFSGAGGRLILYRPGKPPTEAPQVPIVYQLLKSVGHSTMALAEVVGPYVNNPDDKAWRGSMQAYRSRMQSALDGLDATPMQADWRDNNRAILKNNIAFMDECLTAGAIPFATLEAFGKKQAPLLAKNVAWAAQTQVAHWMTVMADWKSQLGADWDKTYGASNTIYVARQNNVIFSVLAQFFGSDAINSRLMLIETISFTTTPSDMLESLTRIIADRSVGALFFGSYHLMDYELMGGDAREAIIAETKKRGMTAFLPPLVPFGSKQWPTLITPGPGPATIADLR